MSTFGITFVINDKGTHKDGYDTIQAYDAIEARDKFKQQNPTAIIVDVEKISE